MEETKVEQITTEETKVEHIKTEETKMEETKAEEQRVEEMLFVAVKEEPHDEVIAYMYYIPTLILTYEVFRFIPLK